jgi:hypothetical protein
MGVLTILFRLPLLPLEGVIRVAELVESQAEQEWHNPAAVRMELEAIAAADQAGELSADEVAQAERDAVARLMTS